MKKIISDIKSACYDNDHGLKKRVIFSVSIILIGSAIIIWFFYFLFFKEDYWNPDNKINLTSTGLMGDFIGGLVGTLFTLVGIILLFETLALQRLELSESRKVFEKQQFENTFFNLLNLYVEVVKGLHYSKNDLLFEDKLYTGKEFFEIQHKEFYSSFTPKSDIQKTRKEATLSYLKFYTSTKEQTAHYFRTIYRIFRFIENSKFDIKDKQQYAKIVRAQLSESECFFLHYNAFTEYGSKFRELINEYNIVKHLPTLEKVEFKKHITTLTQLEKNGVQLVLDDTKLFLKSSLNESKVNYKTYLQGSIAIKTKSVDNSTFTIQIIKKINLPTTYPHQQGSGLQFFDERALENLFVDYVNDLLSYSNYFEFNKKHIRITHSNSTNFVLSKHTIEIIAKNANNQPIKFN